MEKRKVIAEILRVSEVLQSSSVSQNEFEEHGKFDLSTVRNTFGTWNQAVEAAGLDPYKSGGSGRKLKRTDEEYLEELIRLTKQLGQMPTVSELHSKGKFSIAPYRARWGDLNTACSVAYKKFGNPIKDAP